jgi:protein-disulfide isomerase
MGSTKVDRDEDGLTRKQRRERGRGRRRELEAAQAAGAARRRRLTQLALVLAVVAVGIIVVLVASSSSTPAPIRPRTASAVREDREITALLSGIPQHGNVLGQPSAPVTLQYYGDLECPFCKAFTVSALPTLIQKWVRTGSLKVEYHSLETATREAEVFNSQQLAALSAGRQNKLWNFIETFYHEQGEEDTGYVTESFIHGIAEQVPGLNLARWSVDRAEPALASELSSDAQAATDAQLSGTPGFLIGPSDGKASRFEAASFTEAGPFNAEIEKQLAR